jgi:hypothetical protein
MFDNIAYAPITEAKGPSKHHRIFASQITSINLSVAFSFLPGLPFGWPVAVQEEQDPLDSIFCGGQ